MRTLRFIEVTEGKQQYRCCIDPTRKTYELHERTYECGDDGDAENGPRFWESASPWQEIDCGPWDGSEPTEEGILNRVDEVKSAFTKQYHGRFAIRDTADGSIFTGFEDRNATWDMGRICWFDNRGEAGITRDKIEKRHTQLTDRLEVIDLDTAVN